LAQGLTGVLLLAAYVFGVPWLVPILAVFCLAGALLGPHGDPFVALYLRLVAPRVGPAEIEVDSVDLMPFAAITPEDVRRSGEPDLETLRQRAAHAGPITDATLVYRVEFHLVDRQGC